jgi:hypothetical protein
VKTWLQAGGEVDYNWAHSEERSYDREIPSIIFSQVSRYKHWDHSTCRSCFIILQLPEVLMPSQRNQGSLHVNPLDVPSEIGILEVPIFSQCIKIILDISRLPSYKGLANAKIRFSRQSPTVGWIVIS